MPTSKNILQKSFIDAEALEMIRSYHLEPDETYELVKRQDDYYITLVTLMSKLLKFLFDEKMADREDEIKRRLLSVAKGLLLYSNDQTRDLFEGVNQINNTLFVAVIYYVCQYEAIASLVLKNLKIRDFKTRAGRRIYYIIRMPKLGNDQSQKLEEEIFFIDEFIKSGDEEILQGELASLERLVKNDELETLREFFDTKLLCAVLKKFLSHNLWMTLQKHDPSTQWGDYIAYSKKQGILSFLPSQEDAIEKGLLTFKRSFCLGMATSAGKTYITELVIYREIQKNPNTKILYLAPLRSLSRELTARYRKIGLILGFEVRCSYGGHINEIEDAGLDRANLLISTPEAFTSMDIDYSLFSLVICDEGQLIDDFSRGIEYELLLTRLRGQANIRFLFLSAIIPNLSNVNEWLGGKNNEIGDSTYRPCRQRLSLVRWDKSHNQYILDVYGVDYQTVLYSIPIGAQTQLPNSKELSVPTALFALSAGQVMVYSSIKSRCMWLVDEMLAYLERENAQIQQPCPESMKVIEYCAYQLGTSHKLVKCLRKGFVYHHADVPQDIREYIEELLSAARIPLVYCTSTLAEGVNLPIKTLILTYLNNNFTFKGYIGEERIKNIIGRVGRAGRETYGTIVMLEEKPKWLVERALNNDIQRQIKGTLYDYVHYFEEKDEKVEDWLSIEELASTIDSTIVKSSKDVQIEEININTLVEHSFAYQFSNGGEKEKLKSLFAIRYEKMKEFFKQNSYEVFKKSGLTIPEIVRLKEQLAIHPQLIEELTQYNEDRWREKVGLIVDLVMKVKKLNDDEDEEKKKNKRGKNSKIIFTIPNITNVAIGWMCGNPYYIVADQAGIEVDEVLMIVNRIVASYAYKARSIIIYIAETYSIENGKLYSIADMMQYGVYNDFMLYLMSERLSNRIAIHLINDLVNMNGWGNLSNEIKLQRLRMNEAEIVKKIDEMEELPNIINGRLKIWLKYI